MVCKEPFRNRNLPGFYFIYTVSKVVEKDLGYIKVHRATKKHWLWNESRKRTKFEAWLDLLIMANHSMIKEAVGYDLIPIERGQVLTSQESLANSWKWNRESVRLFLRMLENDKMISVNATAKYTMITVCNYDTYQGQAPTSRHQTDIKPPSTLHQTATFNNAKNDNNVKNEEEYTGAAGVHTEDEKKQFEKFIIWVKGNASRVEQMKEPLTIDQFLNLKKEFGTPRMMDVLSQMHNWAPLTKKNTSANLTARQWLKKPSENGNFKHTNKQGTRPVAEANPAGGYGFND